jgi:hypothetical protein
MVVGRSRYLCEAVCSRTHIKRIGVAVGESDGGRAEPVPV